MLTIANQISKAYGAIHEQEVILFLYVTQMTHEHPPACCASDLEVSGTLDSGFRVLFLEGTRALISPSIRLVTPSAFT